ncbi:hypothetical protein OROMI_030729 [Orobanche minor]
MRWKSIYSSLLRFSKSLAYLLPHILCKYLYYLSEMFTNYYSSVCKVGSFAETSTLLLCETTTVVMEKCFLLSGIIPKDTQSRPDHYY